jgi:hypothetical protein
MSILAGLSSNVAGVVEDKDVLGGSSYAIKETGVYEYKVEVAYISESQGGALALNLHLNVDGASVRQQLWMTNKSKQNTFTNKEGKPQFLPGFLTANNLCLLNAGKEISELVPEEKVINLYDYDAKKELPTKVQMIMELIGTEGYAAIEKQTVDKTAKAADGSYQPTGETRDQNEIVKFFRHRDKMTVTEITAQATEAVFLTQWEEKNAGKTRNKAKGIAGATAGAPTASASATPAPKKSLFA